MVLIGYQLLYNVYVPFTILINKPTTEQSRLPRIYSYLWACRFIIPIFKILQIGK